jgi:glycosyltransferase involved in cell wall biosynthesis
MKVAVYTIAKNEEQFVQRWYESSQEADYHLIADTGSIDRTVDLADKLGIKTISVRVIPFRFDDARNASLAALPDDIDYCIALDMDEVLQPGWRQELEKAFEESIDRPQYRFITDWNSDGTPALEFDGFRIHRRKGVRWVYPIHEVPSTYEGTDTRKKYDFQIHHRPDVTKSRGQYLTLLEQAVKESPDSRNYYYLGREYFFRKEYEKCLEVLTKYIEISNFPAEKSFALRMIAKCDPGKAEEWLIQATEACQTREAVLALANHYYLQGQWKECNYTAKLALSKTEKVSGFLSEGWAWGHMADDLVAVSSWQLGDFKTAYKHGKRAVEMSPDDERLTSNLKFYEEKLKDANSKRSNRRNKK